MTSHRSGWQHSCAMEHSQVLTGLAVVLFVLQLALLPVPRSDGHLLNSDGGYYYTYMRSWWLDGDVNIANDIVLYNARVPQGNSARLTETYIFSVGPGLLWSPFFLLGHLLARLAAMLGMGSTPDGFSFLEEACVLLSSVAYTAGALVLLQRVTARLVPEGPAPLAVAGIFLASPCLYYALCEPTMSHTLELFSVSLFFWALLVRPLQSSWAYLVLGATMALMFLVRWQNIVLLTAVVPLVFGLPPFETRRLSWRHLVAGLSSASVGVLPQLLFWKITLGHFVLVPHGAGFLALFEPHLLAVLFSLRHGLFSWHPALALALLGLTRLHFRPLAWSLAAAFVLDLFVCSIVMDWWGGDAFGMRRMLGMTPVFVFGLCAGYATLHSRRLRSWAWTVMIFFVVWNLAFIVQYRLGLIPAGEAVTWRELVLDKFLLPLLLWRRDAG